MAPSATAPNGAAPAPALKDLTIENITDNVQRINAQGADPRTRYVMERLVWHLHEFARETRLGTDEWMRGIRFLTDTGKMCSDTRQEFILLSDVLGLSLLVDNLAHPKPPHSTAGTVLGPFHTLDAEDMAHGHALHIADTDGEQLLCLCSVHGTDGAPVAGCKVDIWETDSHGFYDVQRPGRTGPDGRAVMRSGADGTFWFTSVMPVSYPIPSDGPVGALLRTLGRHSYRPAHIHFMMEKEGYDHLITALYIKGDPYENSDPVFGVKAALVVDVGTVSAEQAKHYNVKEGTRLLEWDFVLVNEEETRELKTQLAKEAMQKLGRNVGSMKIIDGLPVPDVD